MRAGIVVTGTEVLTGRIADRNGPWVSERLAELGVEVAHIVVVADRPDDLEAALRFLAAEGMDLIVTSGGLGPTADDLTAEVVGRFAGRELVLDEEVEEKIAEILRGFARRRLQLRHGRGARGQPQAGDGPGGGDRRSIRSARRRGWSSRPGSGRGRAAGPAARAAADVAGGAGDRRRCARVLGRATPLHGYTLRMFGIPESEIAKSLREIEEEGVALPEVEITTCLRRGEIEIDVRYRDEAAATAEAVRAGLAERHRAPALQPRRGDDRLAGGEAARRAAGSAWPSPAAGACWRRGSPTCPGASAYMAGSVVSYSNEAKAELLGVDPALIESHGAVSPEVAEAMALGALERFGADVAVAITGIAGPEGGSEEKPVGYVCFDARLADGTAIARDPVIPGGRADIRERSALVGMHLLRHAARRRRASSVREAARTSCKSGLSGASAAVAWRAWRRRRLKSPRARLFVALDLPDGMRDGDRGLGREASSATRRCGRLPAASLHITLVFLGYRPEKEIGRIAEIVEALGAPAPTIELRRSRARPQRGRPRSRPAGRVSRRCRAAGRARGEAGRRRLYEPEKRPFWPHLTVARVRPEKRGSRRPRRSRTARAAAARALAASIASESRSTFRTRAAGCGVHPAGASRAVPTRAAVR